MSTRKVDDLVKALGADTGISKSEVSRICADLDEEVTAFRERPLSDMALSMLVRGMAEGDLAEGEAPRWRDTDGRVVVPHGFRTSFRGWTRAKGWPDHLGEIALAHRDKDRVRAAYARDDLLEERRSMMEAWAAWCSTVDTQLLE